MELPLTTPAAPGVRPGALKTAQIACDRSIVRQTELFIS